METIIKIKNLTKKYGKARGIDTVDIAIEKGCIYGFIGPNGAGKSTTIKCLMNYINKNEGQIFVDDQEVKDKNYQMKEKIGYLPSEVHLYEDLSVKKMLEYSNSFYKKDCTQRMNELVQRLDVDVDKKIDELSLGNLKKVGIILALMHEPSILIMDEATSGLDPLMQEEFYEILEEEKAKGTTIFFSSHILSEIKRICDKVAFIKEGKMIRVDDINELNEDKIVNVTIQSKDIHAILEQLQINSMVKKDKTTFIYQNDVNELIKILSGYQMDQLLIQQPTLEEIFMHYYK